MKNYNTSFELNKLISMTGLFSKIELTPAAKLTLRAVTDFWNCQKGMAYPTHAKLAYNTGLTEFSVRKAINELCGKKLIVRNRKKNSFYYEYTATFFRLIDIVPKKPCGTTERKLREFPQESCGKNRIKENKNTSFIDLSVVEECSEIEKDKILLEKFKDNPAFSKIVQKIKIRMNV